MNKPIKPEKPKEQIFTYEFYSSISLEFERNDKKYPFLYLSDIMDHLPQKYEMQSEYIKLDFSEPNTVYIFIPKDFDQEKNNEYKQELKQYNLDLKKYELETAKYELFLAEEKVKKLEKLYAKTGV